MALTQDFYKDILEKEKSWIINLQYNLLNIYYLPELKNFYQEKQNRLIYEGDLTGNMLIRTISFTLDKLMDKIDEFIKLNEEGKDIDLQELKNYFLISVLNNDVYYIKKDRLEEISDNKHDLYELRQKVINEGSEDYLDDDFFYTGKKAA